MGGERAGEKNIISGNGWHGVSLAEDGTTGTIVIGNYIGTDASGTANLGNEGSGVAIELAAFNNLIERNLISGNKRWGICISDWGSSYNTVIGNLIGTDASGKLPLGNEGCGVFVGYMGASFNRIGGTSPEERNVISGNNGSGVDICGSRDVGNILIGNYIGTDVTGVKALGNFHGVSVDGTSERVFIGGMTSGERNIISGNTNGIGIVLGNDCNWVAGNYIGTDASGTNVLGNNMGILINSGRCNAVQGNLISGNKQSGLYIRDARDTLTFHNSLIGNGKNGSDSGLNDRWDLDRQGNYWSDYKGNDKNGDGIGDTAYPVPPNGVDNYPLMKPLVR